MMEVVFHESAAGSLKLAQGWRRGKFRTSPKSVFVGSGKNGESRGLLRQEKERERLACEEAVPFGGTAADIFAFHLMLSVGDISGDGVCRRRLETLNCMFGMYPEGAGSSAAKEIFDRACKDLETIRQRLDAGEQVRIWYSSHPDEMCGLHWFLTQLVQDMPSTKVSIVKLPDWEIKEQTLAVHTGWGEVDPDEWHRYANLQKEVSPVFVSAAASKWRQLQEENAVLRAVINGRLFSVPEDFYDYFIRSEIENQNDEFQEGQLIGRILGKYQLGISDGWLAMRIEKMIENGKLQIITNAPSDCPAYHRVIRKIT